MDEIIPMCEFISSHIFTWKVTHFEHKFHLSFYIYIYKNIFIKMRQKNEKLNFKIWVFNYPFNQTTQNVSRRDHKNAVF